MKRKPWVLVILAFLHIVSPFFNLIFDAYWAHRPLGKYIYLFFQPYNFSHYWFHFFAPIAAGILIYICRLWSYIAYFIMMLGLAVVSYLSYLQQDNAIGVWPLLLVYFVNFTIVTYFLVPAVRNVYLDPRLRWWETMPRYIANFACRFRSGDNDFQGQLANISQSGLFIQTENFPPDMGIVHVYFQHQGIDYEFIGQAIHHARQNTQGFGLKFMHNHHSRKCAKSLTEQLHSEGRLMPSRVPDEKDTFKWWLQQLVKTRQGFFPCTYKKEVAKK